MTIDVIPAGRASIRPVQRQTARAGGPASLGTLSPQTEPERRLVDPPVALDPNAGKAAANIASIISDSNETFQNVGNFILEKEEKERKGAARVKALEGFQTWQGEMQRELITMQSELSGTDADGYTDKVTAYLASSSQMFLDSIEDEEVRNEFVERVANVSQAQQTQAFKDQIVSRRGYVRDSIDRVVENGLAEIRADRGGADRTLALAFEMIDKSGLPDDQKEEMKHNFRLQVEQANLASEARIKQATEAAQRKRRKEQAGDFSAAARNGAIVGNGRVTAWGTAPTMARRTLQAIADTESPGYNVMYTPRGEEWRTFDDFSVHPNNAAIINHGPNAGRRSTAAGKYQINYPTWVWINENIPGGPLPDFSPESQDKAAWWLAEYEYRESTGRDLLTDLQNPTPEVLAQVRDALGNRWEGTAKQSDKSFANAFLAGIEEKDGRDLLAAEGYESLTLEEKIAIITEQEAAAQASISAAEMKAEEARKQNAGRLLKGFNEGKISFKEIVEAAEADQLTPSELKIAQEIHADRQKVVQENELLAERLADDSYVFRNDKSGREDYAKVLDPKVVSDLREGNVSTLVANLPVVAKFREVDQSAIVGAASDISRSTEYGKMSAGFAAMTMLEQTLGPERYRESLSKEDMARHEVWKKLNGTLKPEELVARFNPLNEDAAKLKEERRVRIEKEIKKDPSLLDAETLFDSFDTFAGVLTEGANELPLTDTLFGLEDQPIEPFYNERATQLMAEYRTLVIEQYGENGGDLDAAQQSAAKLLHRTWNVTEFDGKRRLAKWPIETTGYPKLRDSYDWVATQIRTELELPDTTGVYIVGDGITALENAKNRRDGTLPLPSYMVLVEQADGTYDFPLDATGKPQRMSFDFKELAGIATLDLRRARIAKDWAAAKREVQKDPTNDEARGRETMLRGELVNLYRQIEYVQEQWKKGLINGED